jgi:transcriptional regulator with XRE-family HTH domain
MIHARRKSLSLTQAETAKRCGMAQTNYSKVELGKTDPRLSTLLDVSRALSLELMLVPIEFVPAVEAILGQGSPTEDSSLFRATGE